jgi:glyoxylase-like metal-dependent hydrolase (beta-lactamase superfamily II)
VFDTPSADSNTIRARCAKPARIALDRVHDSNNSRSPGRRANGCARIPHSHAPALSNDFRRAALDLFGLITGLPAETAQIPWDGPEVRIIEHPAHAQGHAALLIEGRGVLVAGDMLSDVLIPMLDDLNSTK